jgi:hypothetical protein
MECAKEIYKNPYIFDQKNLTPKERHNNLREALDIIDNSINNTIRNLLPIRDILKQGLTKNNEIFTKISGLFIQLSQLKSPSLSKVSMTSKVILIPLFNFKIVS